MGLFDIFKKKEKKTEMASQQQTIAVAEEDKQLSVVLESLPAVYNVDKSRLIEITDSSFLARIDALIPSAGAAGVSIGNIAGQSRETLYKVVLKNGGKLVDSKTMEGAKRAMVMGKNGIAENANLLAVEPDKAGMIANAGACVFSVASMVVGQYYMQQIDSKLSDIAENIDKIIENIEIQYKSRVSSLIESVYNVSKFQLSSMGNEELRNRELDNIQDLKKECQTLLSEAESKIESILGADSSMYDQYAKKVKDLEKWLRYQELLIQLLYQINNLDFTLYFGTKTKEHCFGSFELHVKKYDTLHEGVIAWHKANCDRFKIDINEARRKHTGLLAILEKPIGLVNEKWNYKAMSYETVGLIKGQTEKAQSIQYNQENPFAENVEIVINGDKKYYLLKE